MGTSMYIKTTQKKQNMTNKINPKDTYINVKQAGNGNYTALSGGNSEARLIHINDGSSVFYEEDLEYVTNQARIHGWQLVVR